MCLLGFLNKTIIIVFLLQLISYYLTYISFKLQIGNMIMERRDNQSMEGNQACILHKQLPGLEYLATCMHMGWMAILVSHIVQSSTGKG